MYIGIIAAGGLILLLLLLFGIYRIVNSSTRGNPELRKWISNDDGGKVEVLGYMQDNPNVMHRASSVRYDNYSSVDKIAFSNPINEVRI
jgi:hypothetical protein